MHFAGRRSPRLISIRYKPRAGKNSDCHRDIVPRSFSSFLLGEKQDVFLTSREKSETLKYEAPAPWLVVIA